MQGTIKVTLTLPIATMARGFALALRRFAAAADEGRADDAHIAMFETLAWLDSLDERCKLAGTLEVRALRFVRNRTHHQWAATVSKPEGTPRVHG
jgi:hypothetical protein